jgi:hypothetical protein
VNNLRTKHVILGCIGLLVAVLAYAILIIPNRIIRAPTPPKWICISNLKQIDGAIQQWAYENKKEQTDAPDFPAAIKYLKNGLMPRCPEGGSYAAGQTIADAPICSKAKELGHTLP